MRQTPLHSRHQALGASFTDFGGWDMPVRYTSDLAEHHAVRDSAGLFDISHMGEIFVTGSGVENFLDYALVGKASEIAIGKAKYSLICNEQAGIIDDLIVYRLQESQYLVVANAANRLAVFSELQSRADGFEVLVQDKSDDYVLLALQGPRSVEILSKLTAADLSTLRYYAISEHEVAGVSCLLARTGYTGEDGFEIYIPVSKAETVFDALIESGKECEMVMAGLACRDTLRLEAGMPLYGHELTINTNPYQVGSARVVRLDKEIDFIAKNALLHQSQSPQQRILVGLRGSGKRAARAGYQIFAAGSTRPVGAITSGALSPTLGYPIAMAMVESSCSKVGEVLEVDVRGTMAEFEVVQLPFYRRQK